MSHPEQMRFVASVANMYPTHFAHSSVLEVGSLNINGSVRQFFLEPTFYVGCDLGPGPGVDIVCSGHQLPFQNQTFDVAISCECFEHDKNWYLTFKRMIELVKPLGLVIFTCATTGRAEHGTTTNKPFDAPYTNDYYKNLTKTDFSDGFDLEKHFFRHQFSVHESSADLYFWGQKCNQS
jgi:SAM-dependent methyltransferase